jgi:diketogulonate reductase-like aldo/keto reductase
MKLNSTSTVTLNNGVKMPLLGLGVYQTSPGKETYSAVLHALKTGYRHIDTAAYYQNEEDVGHAIIDSGIPRKDIFVTTKLKNNDHDNPSFAFDQSLDKLGLDYIDLYLIHWPLSGKRQRTWKILEQIYKSGRVRAIGVSNYTATHLKELMKESKIVPAVNQVEFSPFLYQKELLDFCRARKIQLEAYSPLTQGRRLHDPQLVALAKKYDKTSAQVLIRWTLQHKIVVIPKSANPKRIKENVDVFDFAISPGDMRKLDKCNEDFRVAWDPTDVA